MRIDNQGGMSGGLTVNEMYNKGMGKRTWRFALLLEDNCQMTYLEEETPGGSQGTRDNLPNDPYELTTPELVLAHLKNRNQQERIRELNTASQDLSLPK
jgi:peroxiredoxin